MTKYFSDYYTPVFKFKENQTTTATAVWTPAASAQVVLTSALISSNASGAGTFQLRFGNVGGQIIMTGVTTGSGNVSFSPKGPIVNLTQDQALFFETATSSSTGGWTITCTGFELT